MLIDLGTTRGSIQANKSSPSTIKGRHQDLATTPLTQG